MSPFASAPPSVYSTMQDEIIMSSHAIVEYQIPFQREEKSACILCW